MEKTEKIIKILKFYIRVNNLKNKVLDEKDTQSIANHLFGSMILATAINSEFKEPIDLATIYRLLFLDEFNLQNSDYNFEELKLGWKYKEKNNNNSKERETLSKYKILDLFLTQLINKNEINDISPNELIKEGSTIIASLCNKPKEECEEIFKFYNINFILKKKERTIWNKNHWNIKTQKAESIAEHIIGAIGLALAMYSECNYNIDISKILKMIVIHKINETITIYPDCENIKEVEDKLIFEALGDLNEKDNILNTLYEYYEKQTKEAKYAYYCIKMEEDLQAKIYQDKGLYAPLSEQKNNYVIKNTQNQRLLEEVVSVFDLWYELNNKIYKEDTDFPEFLSMLQIIKMCNLMNLSNESDKKEENISKRGFMQMLKKKKK